MLEKKKICAALKKKKEKKAFALSTLMILSQTVLTRVGQTRDQKKMQKEI